MPCVTIRVLEGMEQGRVFCRIPLPITLGREDDNSIQLNDDRISRFHVKLQDQEGRVILTDLDSTNGTRVNGRPVLMRVLQVGDIISIGRCVLLLMERQDDSALADSDVDPDPHRTRYIRGEGTIDEDDEELEIDFAHPLPKGFNDADEVFPNGRPELPTGLNPLQLVQLSDLLSFIHEQVGRVVRNAIEETSPADARDDKNMMCDKQNWSNLVSLQSDLSAYISDVNTPKA